MFCLKIILINAFSLITIVVFAQVSGNVNYQKQAVTSSQILNVDYPTSLNVYISAKGLANVKADSYVAIFSLTQGGKSTEEVNQLMDQRINQALNTLKQTPGLETFVDMISFVPVYEFEVEKKVFSRKSYNEIPKGFELKKNIHVKFTNSNQLNNIITALSNQEIYDLVRVDYYSSEIEKIKKDLMNRASSIIQEKLKNYESVIATSLTTYPKLVSDGFKIQFPVEMYKGYEAFSSSSLNLKKSANVNFSEKSTTLYYQPIVQSEFDFVLNPVILEPVIQIMYDLKVVVLREKSDQTQEKEYLIITPNGEMKNLNLK